MNEVRWVLYKHLHETVDFLLELLVPVWEKTTVICQGGQNPAAQQKQDCCSLMHLGPTSWSNQNGRAFPGGTPTHTYNTYIHIHMTRSIQADTQSSHMNTNSSFLFLSLAKQDGGLLVGIYMYTCMYKVNPFSRWAQTHHLPPVTVSGSWHLDIQASKSSDPFHLLV